MSTEVQNPIDTLFEGKTSVIARDLKLNLTKFLGASLGRDEAYLALLAAASSVESAPLIAYARNELQAIGLGPDEIREAEESAALMGMLNTYYRFRHYIGSPEEYRMA